MEIQFEAANYTFRENASRGEVCLVSSERIYSNINVTFEVHITGSTSQRQLGLMPDALGGTTLIYAVGINFSMTLQKDKTTVCVYIKFTNNSVVEGNQMFYLVFTNGDPHIILNGASSNKTIQTQVTIKDSTGKSSNANIEMSIKCYYFL